MNCIEKYNSTYKMIGFERKGLFKLLAKFYKADSVLYPGSSFHITPSFYFTDVLYLDISKEAEEFFSQKNVLDRFISSNKEYKSSGNYKFLKADYTKVDLEPIYKFDLLISLYADHVAINTESYLKNNALVLTNNFHDEARRLQNDPNYILKYIIDSQKGLYKLIEVASDYKINHRNEEKVQKKCMHETSDGIRYIDNEVYYVFEFQGAK